MPAEIHEAVRVPSEVCARVGTGTRALKKTELNSQKLCLDCHPVLPTNQVCFPRKTERKTDVAHASNNMGFAVYQHSSWNSQFVEFL